VSLTPKVVLDKKHFIGEATIVVFKEGDVVYALDNRSKAIIAEDAVADRVIQRAVDTIGLNKGSIWLKGDYEFGDSVILKGDTGVDIYSDGVIYPPIGKAAFILGSDTESYSCSKLFLNQVMGKGSGVAEGRVALEVRNAAQNLVKVNRVWDCKYAVHVKPTGANSNDNHFEFGVIDKTDKAIYFNPAMTKVSQGNRWKATIFNSNVGIEINNPTVGGSNALQLFEGTIDNIGVTGGKDIVDNVGQNIFIMTYVRNLFDTSINTIQDSTIVIDPNSQQIVLGKLAIVREAGVYLFRNKGVSDFWGFKQDPTKEEVELGYGKLMVKKGGAVLFRGINRQLLTADKTLTINDPSVQSLDPGDANRNVILPAADINSAGIMFIIKNLASATYTLTVKDSAGNTVVTINPLASAIVVCDGVTWLTVS